VYHVEHASQYVPPTPSRKATSIRLIPTPAWTAAHAPTLAPLVQLLPANNQDKKTKQNNCCGYTTTVRPQYFLPPDKRDTREKQLMLSRVMRY